MKKMFFALLAAFGLAGASCGGSSEAGTPTSDSLAAAQSADSLTSCLAGSLASGDTAAVVRLVAELQTIVGQSPETAAAVASFVTAHAEKLAASGLDKVRFGRLESALREAGEDLPAEVSEAVGRSAEKATDEAAKLKDEAVQTAQDAKQAAAAKADEAVKKAEKVVDDTKAKALQRIDGAADRVKRFSAQ